MKKDRDSDRISPSPDKPVDLMSVDFGKLYVNGSYQISARIENAVNVSFLEPYGILNEGRNTVFISSFVFSSTQLWEMDLAVGNRGDSFEIDVVTFRDSDGVDARVYGFLHLEFLRSEGKLFLWCRNDRLEKIGPLEVSAAWASSVEDVDYSYVLSKARQVCGNIDWMLYRRDYCQLRDDHDSYKLYDVPKKWWLGPLLVCSGWISFVTFDLKWLPGITLFGVAYWVSYEVMNRILDSKKRRFLEFVRGFR